MWVVSGATGGGLGTNDNQTTGFNLDLMIAVKETNISIRTSMPVTRLKIIVRRSCSVHAPMRQCDDATMVLLEEEKPPTHRQSPSYIQRLRSMRNNDARGLHRLCSALQDAEV